MPRLADLKARAQEHYAERLDWTDLPGQFGGSAWADVDHHTISVMVNPPPGNPHIAVIRDGQQEPLIKAPILEASLDTAYQLAMEL